MSKNEWDERPEVLIDRMIRLASTDHEGRYLPTHFDENRQLEIHFLKGVVLAMLAGEKPPFQPGDKVIAMSKRQIQPSTPTKLIFALPRFLPSNIIAAGKTVEIVRVHYTSKDTWHVELEGHRSLLYRAKDFTFVPATDNPPDSKKSEPVIVITRPIIPANTLQPDAPPPNAVNNTQKEHPMDDVVAKFGRSQHHHSPRSDE